MGQPRKLPSREEVVRLYVEENRGTPEIARMFGVSDPHTVRSALLRAGVTLRRHTVRETCVEEGCRKPVAHVRHNKFGLYGKRCEEHQKAHRKKVCSDWSKRFRKENPELAKERFDKWINRIRSMTFEELYQEIKEKPCRFKKEELLRKMRNLNRMGRSQEAITLALESFHLLQQKQESRDLI